MSTDDRIPADDRGFTLGDGLFETLLAIDGELIALDAHLARLRAGCETIGLPPPLDAEVARAIEAALAASDGLPRIALRLSYSAGSGGRGLERPPAPAPRLVATAAAAPPPGRPLKLITASTRRNEGSAVSRLKSLSYIDSVLARREARAKGADEALMLNNRGELASAAAANLFWLEGRSLFTPALECGVLAGVVRAALVARAGVREVRAGPEALERADAVFLTNSLIGLAPAAELDGRPFAAHPRREALAELVADLVPPVPEA
jgi:branched-chain amino acid aminotransferase/4-amino-4-deoxychorismate lyase